MRKLVWFSGGFGAACLLSCYGVDGLWPVAVAAAFFLLAIVLWRCSRLRKGEPADLRLMCRTRRILFDSTRRLTALCLGGVLAFGWFAAYSSLFRAPAMELAGTKQTMSGTVISYPVETSIGGYSMTVRLDGGMCAPDVLLYGSEEWEGLAPGDRVRCTARFEASDRLYGDETSYYTAKGVFLLAYCDEVPEVERAEKVPVRCWPALCAQKLKEGIYAAFDETAAPLAAAVTLGDRTGLDEQLYSALNRSGVMHAAVVSGMHISFLVSVLMILCRGNRRVALCLVPLLLFYALMAGGTPSAFRAVIMQTALLAGAVLGREADPPSSLGLALLVLLVQNPFAAASVSLQLSFASVAGILLVTERLNDAMIRPVKKRLGRRKVLMAAFRFVAAEVAVSLGAMLFAVPIIALYFGKVVLIAPLTNVLVLWAVTVLMVAALVIGTLAIVLPQIMGYPGMVFGMLGHYIRHVTMAIGAWPLAALSTHFAAFRIWTAAVYLQIPGWVFSGKRRKQLLVSLLCIALLLGGAVGINRHAVSRNDLTVVALDVGQGASTLFLTGEHVVLVDCGGSGSDSAGDLAADYLAAQGRRELDLLVLTHLDDDHFNGVAQLLYRLDVRSIAAPDVEGREELARLAEQEGAQLLLVETEQKLAFGGMEFTLYPPLGQWESNESGLLVLCSAEGFDTLITGDASAFVERMLVKYYNLPDLELLMVGHHGSKYSTCRELLDALRPELAVISVGYNAYGHPTEEVLERLAQSGTEIYRTDENGTVTIAVKDGMIAVN